jgi:hypothetical protein
MRHSFAPLDRECEDFLGKKLRINFFATDWSQPQWLCASARDDQGHLMGVCVFEFKTWFDAHFSCAIADRRCMSRRLLRALFTAVFSRAVRVTALIEPWNDSSIRQAKRMGFQVEGFSRLAVEGSRDALILGMLKSDCRYLVSRETSRKVSPAFPKLDLADMNLVDAEAGSDLSLRAGGSSDFPDLVRRKLGHLVVLTGLVVGMTWPFGGIGFSARPAQMALVDAGAVATAVSGIRHSVRSRSIDPGADQIVNADDQSMQMHLPITMTVERIGPDQAFIAFVGQNRRQIALNDTALNHDDIVRMV